MATPLQLWSDEEYQDRDNTPKIADTFTDDSQIVLHPGETYEFLRTLPDRFAKLIITSPPYNVGKEYEVRATIHDSDTSQCN